MIVPPKPSNGFLSKIRRNMHINRTPASASTETPRTSPSRNAWDVSSSSDSSSSSSDLNTRLTPQHRRPAALFSKITFGTSENIHGRYVYSSSSDESLLSHVLHYNSVEDPESGLYSAIPSSEEAYIHRLNPLFFEGTTCRAELNPSLLPELPPAQSPLRSAFRELLDFQADDFLEHEHRLHDETPSDPFTAETKEPMQGLLAALYTSLRSDPTEFSSSSFSWDAETFPNVTQSIEREVVTESRAVPGRAAAANHYHLPTLVARDPSPTRAKPRLSRQRRASPRPRAKPSSDTSEDLNMTTARRFAPHLLPTASFVPLPEDFIGMAF